MLLNFDIFAINYLGLLKLFILLGLLVYVAFALVVVRQVFLLNDTLQTKISPWLKVAAIVNTCYGIFSLLFHMLFL